MPQNPKIAIFIKGLDMGGYSGGADLFGVNLAAELHKLGVEVTLYVCFRFNTEAERNILNTILSKDLDPIFLLDWTGHTSAKVYLNAAWKLYTFTKDLHIDIIHSHFHTGTLLSIFLKLIRRVRRVVRTAHVDHEWLRGWNGIVRQAIIRTFIFVIFPIFVDLEVGVSNYTVELLNQRFVARISRKQAVVIHNAIPIQDGFEKSIPRKSFTSWISDHPIVGSVGRLEVQKGYEFFLDSLPAILLLYPTLEIWLIGDGALRLELEEHCQRLGIYEHIVFWGKQNNISAFLSKMDLFVSSSLYEGLPTVVLEAMVYGVPCVVTDIPGTRDIAMQENVLIVPARDSKALANSISLALNDPHLRKTLMENAIQTIGRFRIDNISLMYLAAYHKL